MSAVSTLIPTISEKFGELGITITNQQIASLERAVTHFVLRKTHPLTFDGPYLGVDPVAFTTSDYHTLFDIFNVHEKDVEKAIRQIPSIDRNFNVISDPFNLLSMWLVHLAPIYIKDKRICHNFMMSVLRYFHYKIFCSVVNNSFKHGTNKGVVEATIATLTKKSDIIKYESWRLLIDSHCEKILDPKDRFWKTLVDGSPDDMFLRVISESQTALRSKIVTFARAYYEVHTSGETVGFKSSVSENDEGEKILAQTASVIESATASIISEVLNPNMFVNDIAVADIADLFSTISPRMLKTALLKINETAVLQTASNKFDETKMINKELVYIGIRSLMLEIIRSMTRTCRLKLVNMGNKAQVFETMRDTITSSRINDPDIKIIKRSLNELIDSFNITSNPASAATLRIAVYLYIIYRVLNRLHT